LRDPALRGYLAALLPLVRGRDARHRRRLVRPLVRRTARRGARSHRSAMRGN
jgi:hypothetical protein